MGLQPNTPDDNGTLKPNTPSDDGVLNRRLARLDSQIKIEFDLVGHRISWLLVANAFLFSAYVLTLNHVKSEDYIWQIKILTISLPAIGAVSSLLVGMAVYAAHWVMKKLKPIRDKLEQQASSLYEYEQIGIATNKWPHRIGNWPPNVLPPLLFVIWMSLLIVTLASSCASV